MHKKWHLKALIYCDIKVRTNVRVARENLKFYCYSTVKYSLNLGTVTNWRWRNIGLGQIVGPQLLIIVHNSLLFSLSASHNSLSLRPSPVHVGALRSPGLWTSSILSTRYIYTPLWGAYYIASPSPSLCLRLPFIVLPIRIGPIFSAGLRHDYQILAMEAEKQNNRENSKIRISITLYSLSCKLPVGYTYRPILSKKKNV